MPKTTSEIPTIPGSETPPPTKSLVGKLFGRLAVTAFKARSEANKALIYTCRCACGSLTEARASDLTSGKKSSCGCLLRTSKAPTQAMPPGPPNKTLLNRTFGLLTVQACQGPDSDGTGLVWQCQCSCGRTTVERTGSLLGNTATSCGCAPIADPDHTPAPAPAPTAPVTASASMQVFYAWREMWIAAADPADPNYMVEPGWKPLPCSGEADGEYSPATAATNHKAWRDSQGYLRFTYPDNAPVAAWRDYKAFANDVGMPPSPKHQLGRERLYQPHGPDNSSWGLGGWGRARPEPLDERTRIKPFVPRAPTVIECLPKTGGAGPKNLAGQQFGMLTADTYKGRSLTQAPVWTCTCECGRTTDATATQLLTGQVGSCGCRP